MRKGKYPTREFVREYNSFRGMRERCSNPKAIQYRDYGARGIAVCARWSVFDNFVEDMGLRPPGLTLDRINNEGNYCRENCRWLTPVAQGANTRVNQNVTFNGVTKNAKQWSRDTGIAYGTITPGS